MGTCLLCAGIVIVFALVFYRSFWAVPFLSPIGFFCFRYFKERKRKKTIEELVGQFMECILAVSVSLKAGYSTENAFLESESDMKTMFGENALIIEELKRIRRGLSINIPLEEMLADLGNRSNSDVIYRFSEIFAIAKRNGGNMPEIIRTTAGVITSRLEVKKETDAILAGKKMELWVMRMMPFFMLIYIEITTPGYFDCLYHNVRGVLIMTACLLVYAAAFMLGEVMLNKLVAGEGA